MARDGLRAGADGVTRCGWCGDDPLYVAYHDEDWGRRVTDERELFEKLLLDGAQAGLAWITILRKREGYRYAFMQAVGVVDDHIAGCFRAAA